MTSFLPSRYLCGGKWTTLVRRAADAMPPARHSRANLQVTFKPNIATRSKRTLCGNILRLEMSSSQLQSIATVTSIACWQPASSEVYQTAGYKQPHVWTSQSSFNATVNNELMTLHDDIVVQRTEWICLFVYWVQQEKFTMLLLLLPRRTWWARLLHRAYIERVWRLDI